MDLRRAFFARSMRLLQHPTVARALSDPRAMDWFVAAVRTKEQLTDLWLEARRRLAHAVGLATTQEVSDLKVVIRDLERQMRRSDGEWGQ
jgi:hypothetical protein